MMAHVPQRLVHLLADFAQFQPLKIVEFQCPALHFRKPPECLFQLLPVEFGGNFAFQIRRPRQSIVKRIDFCTSVKAAPRQIRMPVECAMISDLNDPRLGRTLGRIEELRLAVDIKEDLLNNFLRLTAVTENTQADVKNETRIPIKQNMQSV